MHQPSSLLTVAFFLLPLSTLISATLDSGSQNGSGNQNGNVNPNANGNGNGNANANQNQNENKNKNENENENYNYNYNQNNNYNTNVNFNWNDNDNNNINANDNDNDNKDKNRDGSPHVVYTTEIVATLTTYCPSATEIEQNGVTYTVTEASTLTITDCPCTQTRALPGLILTPAILPQPGSPSTTNPLTTPSPTNPALLPLIPLSSLPASIPPPQSFPSNNADILAASILPSGSLPPNIPAASITPLNNAVGSTSFQAVPSEVGSGGFGSGSGSGTNDGADAGGNGPAQFLGAAGRREIGSLIVGSLVVGVMGLLAL